MTDQTLLRPEPLRDRQRSALRSAIERTAIELSRQHGFDNVTVEMICEASMTSPRTFYNYFGSREGVILGAQPPMPAEAEIESFIMQPKLGLLADFFLLLTSALARAEADRGQYLDRQSVVEKSAVLTAKRAAMVAEQEDEYVKIILARFTAQGRVGSPEELEDDARMAMALSGALLSHTRRKWFHPEFNGTPESLLDDSIELIRRVANDKAVLS